MILDACLRATGAAGETGTMPIYPVYIAGALAIPGGAMCINGVLSTVIVSHATHSGCFIVLPCSLDCFF